MENKPICLLLVEDNPGDACLFQEVVSEVRNATFSVAHADQLDQAIRQLEESEFDIVLLDLLLPDSMGYDTFVRARTCAPKLPIIVLTGTDDDMLALRCVKGGAQDYLVKGDFTSQVLVRTIRHAIERHRLLMELEKTASLLARKSEALAQTLKRVAEIEMNRAQLSLESCVDRAIEGLSRQKEECGAKITRDRLPDAFGDQSLLTQLYQNLIGNALKFKRDVRPEIHLTAERQDGKHWVLGVKDNGIGISKKFADRVFLPFQRLNSRLVFSGTGIGLALCRKIVERHGGAIWVESAPGEGSHFKFTIAEKSIDGSPDPSGSSSNATLQAGERKTKHGHEPTRRSNRPDVVHRPLRG